MAEESSGLQPIRIGTYRFRRLYLLGHVVPNNNLSDDTHSKPNGICEDRGPEKSPVHGSGDGAIAVVVCDLNLVSIGFIASSCSRACRHIQIRLWMNIVAMDWSLRRQILHLQVVTL